MNKKVTFVSAGDHRNYGLFVEDECIWNAKAADSEDTLRLLTLADSLAKQLGASLGTVYMNPELDESLDVHYACNDWDAIKSVLVGRGLLPAMMPFAFEVMAIDNKGEQVSATHQFDAFTRSDAVSALIAHYKDQSDLSLAHIVGEPVANKGTALVRVGSDYHLYPAAHQDFSIQVGNLVLVGFQDGFTVSVGAFSANDPQAELIDISEWTYDDFAVLDEDTQDAAFNVGSEVFHAGVG